jgi:hypothetical protein
MTIPFDQLKARLLANVKVKAEYEALAPEFETAAELQNRSCGPRSKLMTLS